MTLRRALILAAALWALPCDAAPSGTFRQAHNVGNGAMSSLDPAANGRILQITEKIMSRLVRPGPDGAPAPDLATGWSVSDDGTVWTFDLRRGVRFHDGSSFDAADVVYSLGRVLDPAADNPIRPVIGMVSRIEAPDPHQVRFILSSRFADLPLQLMDYRLRIIPDGSGGSIGQTGIGTGPFRIDRFDPTGISLLSAFDDYWEGRPGLDRIEIIGIPDSQARLQAFLGGQIDIDRAIAPLLRNALARKPDYVLQEIPTGNWSGVAMRTDLPPFDDVRVRRAFRLAADRGALLKLALDGLGTVTCDTPVAPNDPYRAPMSCPQDIPAARALLSEAGHPDGLDVEVFVSALDPTWLPMTVALQAQVARAGFRLKITQAAADGYWSEVWGRKPACLTSWGERPADQILNEAFRSGAKWNETHFRDARFDALLDTARHELDPERRKQGYIAAQTYLARQSGTLIPFHISQLVGLSARVHGLPAVRNDAIRWHLVRVDPD